MAEWHITPDYIVNNWTDELFDLMCEKFGERRQRENDAATGKKTVSVEALAFASGGKIKVEKPDS